MKSIFFFLPLMGFLTASCERTSPERGDGVAQLCSADAVCMHTDTLGTTVRMKMVESCYALGVKDVYAIVLNPELLRLSYGRFWKLQLWENNQWTDAKMKGAYAFFDDEMIPLDAPVYYCFRYPVACYDLVPGRYRILQSLWDDRREIKLSAEFWILKR
ncbi:MAG: immunoglobulin-like domain-containing protein [Phocaeicola sp.]